MLICWYSKKGEEEVSPFFDAIDLYIQIIDASNASWNW